MTAPNFSGPTSVVALASQNGTAVGPTNPVPVTPSVDNATATLSAVASLATTQQLLAANTGRKGVLIVNTDANTLRLKYGTTASASSFTVAIPSNGYWEMPTPTYAGRIDGIWDADGAGSAYITELS